MLVSVIIPTFNRSRFVSEAVKSVLGQSYPDKEIIVVDDGSTDDTAERLAEFGDRIRHVRTENGGVPRARNIGISASRGDLIAFLDSDDLWLPNKLGRQVEYFAANPDIHVAQTEEIWIRGGRRVNPKNIHKKRSGWIFERCIPRCIVSPSAVMLRRRVFEDVGLFDEAMPVCEDYDLWLRVSLKYQIVTLPCPLIVKRGGHPDQLSRQPLQDVWRIYALRKILDSGTAGKHEAMIRADIARREGIVESGRAKRRTAIIAP
jgi:glycosyltransferase involved in cell wall biosynthesis